MGIARACARAGGDARRASGEIGASVRDGRLGIAFFETFGNRRTNLPEQFHEVDTVIGIQYFENSEHGPQSRGAISVVRLSPGLGQEHIDATPIFGIDAAFDVPATAVFFEGADDTRHLRRSDADVLLNFADGKRLGFGKGIEAEELGLGELIAAARLARAHDRHELPQLEDVIRHLLEAMLFGLAQPEVQKEAASSLARPQNLKETGPETDHAGGAVPTTNCTLGKIVR